MVSRNFIFLLYLLSLVGIAAIGFSFFDQLGCDGQLVNINLQPSSEQEIWGDRTIGQSFVAPWNGLNRVDIFFQTYDRPNTGEVSLRLLELLPNGDNPLQGTEVFSATFQAATVKDQAWQTFNFPAVLSSTGKTYFILLHSPTSKPGNAITVGGFDKDVYPSGSAFLGTDPIPADITFRACFQMSLAEKLHLLAEQVTRHRPAVWGSIIFYLMSLGIYGGLMTGFLRKLHQSL
ncbi:MAG: hypothetical protein U0401_33120 [Anaerolineae bacterium]